MIKKFPYEFTLDNGTHVVVTQTGANTYEFSLTPKDEPASRFTFVDDDRPKAAWDEQLEFEQLDALRTFWLAEEDVV